MKILVISSNYPNSAFPQIGTFVYKLVQEFMKQKKEVIVISPQKIHIRKKSLGENYGVEKATVFRPNHWSLSNKSFLLWNTYSLTRFFQSMAIKRVIVENKIQSDVVYCHFISSALLYLKAFPQSTTPLFVAVGEYKNIDVVRSYYDKEAYDAFLRKITGFIAVSVQIKLKLLEIGVPENKIMVAPNGTDLSTFKLRNKIQLRKKYGLPLEKKIVLFVGRFLDNKGPLRVLDALNQLDDSVRGVFIGKGPQEIEGNKIIFQGTVMHNQVAEFMSLADIFVLPTLHEGSSNVIIEAMASGLPIVSSDIPEIQAQCDPSFSFLVDPNDVSQITSALKKLVVNNDLRKRMSKNALNNSKNYDLTNRAVRILNFIENKI